jgi:hypothetical protein
MRVGLVERAKTPEGILDIAADLRKDSLLSLLHKLGQYPRVGLRFGWDRPLDPCCDARAVVRGEVHVVQEVAHFAHPLIDGEELSRAVDLHGQIDAFPGDVFAEGFGTSTEDVLERRGNTVILWDKTPSDEERETVDRCLRP